MLPTCYRQLALAGFVATAIGGCSAAGEPSGARTVSDAQVPFTFKVPADFTKASVDQFESRGDVVAAVGVDKLDVVAVRRLPATAKVPRGDVPHRTFGQAVTSRLHAFTVAGQRWAIECQWRPDRREKVLDACRQAIGSITRR